MAAVRCLLIDACWLPCLMMGYLAGVEALGADAPASAPASQPAGTSRLTPLFKLQHPVVDERFAAESCGGFFIGPGSKHIACVERNKEGEAVILDGTAGKTYDEVLRVVFSPDGEHLAYMAHRDEKQVVVLDGKEGPEFDAIDEGPDAIAFSPDSNRLAYIVKKFELKGQEKVERRIVVLDGRESKAYDEIIPAVKDLPRLLQFSPDSKRLIFHAQRGEQRFIVTDLVEADDDGRQRTVFSPDGKREAHVVLKAGGMHVLLDGVLSPPYNGIADESLTFSADGKHFAYAAAKVDPATKVETWRVVLDGKEGKAYDMVHSVRLGPDVRLGFVARDEKKNKFFTVIDGKEGPACDQAEYLQFTPDGKRYAYIAWHGDKQSVVVDGIEGRQYHSVDWMTLAFSPGGKHFMYAARSAADKEVLVVDGKAGRPCDKVFAPRFSGDGEHVLYVAGNGGKYADEDIYDGGTRTVVLDGREQVEFASLAEGDVVLCHDGRHWACWGTKRYPAAGLGFAPLLDSGYWLQAALHQPVQMELPTVAKDFIMLDGVESRGFDDVVRPLAFEKAGEGEVLRAVVRDGRQVLRLEIKPK